MAVAAFSGRARDRRKAQIAGSNQAAVAEDRRRQGDPLGRETDEIGARRNAEGGYPCRPRLEGADLHRRLRHPALPRCCGGTSSIRGRRLVVLIGRRRALAIAVKGAQAKRRWSKLRKWLEGPSALDFRSAGLKNRPVKGLHRWPSTSWFLSPCVVLKPRRHVHPGDAG